MAAEWKLCVSKIFLIPQRWIVGIMGFWCFALVFMLRVCLNIAITQMVISKAKNNTSFDPDECPAMEVTFESSNRTMSYPQYDWDEELQGIILGSFFYGYVLTHVPGGIIAEKYSAKYVVGFGLLITSILTIATPALVQIGGAPLLIVVRVIEGLGEGPSFPALTALMSRWVTEEERGLMGGLIFGGAQIGNILGMMISGFVMNENQNWPLVFYIFGAMGVVWFIFWIILVHDDPAGNPFITDSEKEYLDRHIVPKTKKPVPWKPILTSIPLWSIVIAAIGHDWGYFTIVTDLPKYMNDVMKFNIKNTGLLSALPYAVMWVTGFIFGWISDWLIKKKYLSIKNSRKIFNSIASIGPGMFLVGASYVGCDSTYSVLMFTIGMGLMGAYYCGMKVNVLDITPNYAGVATALVNGTAALSGIVTPYIVGVVAPDQTRKEWQIVFWIVFGVLTVTDLIYVVFTDGKEQWWNDIDKNGYPPNWKVENNIALKEIDKRNNSSDEIQPEQASDEQNSS